MRCAPGVTARPASADPAACAGAQVREIPFACRSEGAAVMEGRPHPGGLSVGIADHLGKSLFRSMKPGVRDRLRCRWSVLAFFLRQDSVCVGSRLRSFVPCGVFRVCDRMHRALVRARIRPCRVAIRRSIRGASALFARSGHIIRKLTIYSPREHIFYRRTVHMAGRDGEMSPRWLRAVSGAAIPEKRRLVSQGGPSASPFSPSTAGSRPACRRFTWSRASMQRYSRLRRARADTFRRKAGIWQRYIARGNETGRPVGGLRSSWSQRADSNR